MKLLQQRQDLFMAIHAMLSDEGFNAIAATIPVMVPKADIEKIMRDANKLCRQLMEWWEADLVAICTDTPAADLPDGLDFEHD